MKFALRFIMLGSVRVPCNCLPRRSADEGRSRRSPACAGRRICNAEPRLLFYFFLGDFITPSAMHSHLPLRSIQVSTQT